MENPPTPSSFSGQPARHQDACFPAGREGEVSRAVQADHDLLVRHVIAAPFFSVCFVLFRGLDGCERFSILLVVALRETLCLAFVIAASSLGGRFCVCVVLSFCAIAALHGRARAFVCAWAVWPLVIMA